MSTVWAASPDEAETVAGLAVVVLVVVERVAGAANTVGVDGIEKTGVVLLVDGSHAGETSAHDPDH